MQTKYNIWFRDPREVVRQILVNPIFANEMDLRPFQEYSPDDQSWQFKDFMSGTH